MPIVDRLAAGIGATLMPSTERSHGDWIAEHCIPTIDGLDICPSPAGSTRMATQRFTRRAAKQLAQVSEQQQQQQGDEVSWLRQQVADQQQQIAVLQQQQVEHRQETAELRQDLAGLQKQLNHLATGQQNMEDDTRRDREQDRGRLIAELNSLWQCVIGLGGSTDLLAQLAKLRAQGHQQPPQVKRLPLALEDSAHAPCPGEQQAAAEQQRLMEELAAAVAKVDLSIAIESPGPAKPSSVSGQGKARTLLPP